MTAVDTRALETKVKDLYRHVAEQPSGPYHFAMGRPLAESLGYPAALLDRVPAEAVESFAGVGWFLDLAALRPGESVVDLGSGSGTDSCCAALLVGGSGHVVGIDLTPEQLRKARRLTASGPDDAAAFPEGKVVEFRAGRIEDPPVDDESADSSISLLATRPDRGDPAPPRGVTRRPTARRHPMTTVTHRRNTAGGSGTTPGTAPGSLRLGSALMALAGLAFIAYAVIFFIRNFTDAFLELGVGRGEVDVGRSDIRAFSPELYDYIAHLHIAVSGFIAAAGLATVALAWFGVRRGLLWAYVTAIAVPVLGLAVALPAHYPFDLDTLGHLGLIYLATGVFVVGALIALRPLLAAHRERG
ncbi:methyltransferase domain-containing protein [Streptomyces sp. NPDC047928]|uniref:methyltransferase domain-containing protein n=1 Tax=unclassified Streptomyces TaxID=2593676 RepID=UPI00371EA2D5